MIYCHCSQCATYLFDVRIPFGAKVRSNNAAASAVGRRIISLSSDLIFDLPHSWSCAFFKYLLPSRVLVQEHQLHPLFLAIGSKCPKHSLPCTGIYVLEILIILEDLGIILKIVVLLQRSKELLFS